MKKMDSINFSKYVGDKEVKMGKTALTQKQSIEEVEAWMDAYHYIKCDVETILHDGDTLIRTYFKINGKGEEVQIVVIYTFEEQIEEQIEEQEVEEQEVEEQEVGMIEEFNPVGILSDVTEEEQMLNDIVSDMLGYSFGYLRDVMQECADGLVSVYYSGQWDFANRNRSWVDDCFYEIRMEAAEYTHIESIFAHAEMEAYERIALDNWGYVIESIARRMLKERTEGRIITQPMRDAYESRFLGLSNCETYAEIEAIIEEVADAL